MSASYSSTDVTTNNYNYSDSFNRSFNKVSNYDKVGNVYIGSDTGESVVNPQTIPYIAGIIIVAIIAFWFRK